MYVLLRYTKSQGFSPYLSQVMLISQKVMQDKRVVTDFRLLNLGWQRTIWHTH